MKVMPAAAHEAANSGFPKGIRIPDKRVCPHAGPSTRSGPPTGMRERDVDVAYLIGLIRLQPMQRAILIG